MAPPLILRIITDAQQAFKTNDELVASYTKVGGAMVTVGERAKLSADAEIAANAKAIESSRARVAALTAANAKLAAGSDEAIAGSVALNRAQADLNRSLGETSVGLRGTSAASQTAERDLSKLSRGVLAGSGAASALGRSLAFASTGFIAVAGTAELLKTSVGAALELTSTQRSVEAQLKTSGKSWDVYGARVNAADLKLSHLSGFTNQELLQSFGYLVRPTGNVTEALKLNAVAADVARGRNISLSAAAIALAKALGGSETALKRLGITIPDNVSRMEALAYVQQKFAGQAAASATVGDRFHASLVDTEEIIGTALLPTFSRLTTEVSDWFAKMDESGRLQKDVNEVVKDAGSVFHTFGTAIGIVDKATGSFAHTLELLAAFKFASLVTGWIGNLGRLAAQWGLVTKAAEGATAAETTAVGGAGVAGAAGRGSGLAGAAGTVGATALASRVGMYTGAGQEAAANSSFLSKIPTGARAAPVAAFGAIADQLSTTSKNVNGWTYISIDGGKHWIQGPYVGYPAIVTPQLKSFGRTGNLIPKDLQAPGFGIGASRRGAQQAGPFGSATPIAVYSQYTQTIPEQIAAAQAALTKTTKDDVAEAKSIIARIKKLIAEGHLAGASLVQALQDEAAQEGVLSSARQQAAQEAAKVAAAKKAAASSYTTPIDLQLAEARAELTASSKDDVAAERKILAAAKAAIASGKKNKEGQLAALQVELQAQQALQSLQGQSATSYSLPARLQLQLARAQATGGDVTAVLLREKAALEKALKASKGNIEKQTDIYNQIAAINSQLGSSAQSALGNFKQASTKALTSNLGLTAAQRKALRARLSQLGPGGTVPGSGIGAGGFIIDPTTGRPIHRGGNGKGSSYGSGGGSGKPPVINANFDLKIYLDKKEIEAVAVKAVQKDHRRRPTQRRGPHAGGGN